MLQSYRQELDIIDTEILTLLAKRNKISQKIGKYKHQHNLSIHQPERREQVLIDCQEQAKKIGLSPIFIKDLRNRIHQESLSIQEKNG